MCNSDRFTTCPYCGGEGIEVFRVTVYEHGCGFPHDDSDERPCRECNGSGWVNEYGAEPLDPMRGVEFPFAKNH